MDTIKIKPMTREQILISVDRLTRFKNTEEKYVRVFCDILINNLIYPKYKRNDLENMDYEKLTRLAEHIINYSITELGKQIEPDYLINQRLYDYEKSVFNITSETENLLKNKISYKSILDLIDSGASKNLNWLKVLSKSKDIKSERETQGLRFPVCQVLIAEGATEETLLPEFARLCGYDFDKKGVYVLSAGGKNQVVKLYYKLSQILKISIFVLLDKDAEENLSQIRPKLRPGDKIHLLNCGEFEDLLPMDLVKRSLDYALNNISIIEQEMLNQDMPRVKILEEVFKTRGMHEFKKVEFAKIVKKNIKTDLDISGEIRQIIKEIQQSNTLSNIN